jgi:hypothetical protein
MTIQAEFRTQKWSSPFFTHGHLDYLVLVKISPDKMGRVPISMLNHGLVRLKQKCSRMLLLNTSNAV